MILATGMYNIPDPSTAGAFLYQALPGAVPGPAFSQAAVDSIIPGWGAGFVAIPLLFFVFTPLMAYYYIAEPNTPYINRHVHTPWPHLLLRRTLISPGFPGVLPT